MSHNHSFLKITNKYSLLAIALYALIAFTHRDTFRPYLKTNKVIAYDMAGYYTYIPALFIYNDWQFEFLRKSVRIPFAPVKAPTTSGKTVRLNKYSIGPAILNTPFFLLGHLEAYFWMVPRDGFSYTYLFWMITGCISYIILALFLLRSILLRYYRDIPVAITLLALGLGTNLLYYTVYEFLMSHTYSFFLFALTLYLGIRWLEQPKFWVMAAWALAGGVLAITRLPNMVFFLVPVFWAVHSFSTLVERLQLYQKHWKSVALGLCIFTIPFIPQFLYWYSQTGYLLINPYGSNGEHFFFRHPMIAEILIGYRKGWLIYTPIMIFGFLGFRTLLKEQKELFSPLFLYTLINIYVVSSWHSWWYGGSFGMRALIECSVALSIPMTAFIQAVGKNSISSHLTAIIISAFIGLNIFQSYQYYHGLIHCAAMSRKSYWAVFGVMPPAHPYYIQQRNQHLIFYKGVKEANREIYQQTIW